MAGKPKDPGGDKWKGPLPKGWTDESRKKFWDSLTSRAPKHKVSECIKKMEGTSISDPGAFCAALADRVIPGWREEAAKERRKKRALSSLGCGAAVLQQPLRTRRDYGESATKDPWIGLQEMEELCPPCAEKMRSAGFKRVRASVVKRLLRDAG